MPRSAILSGTTRVDIPSLHIFLEILSRSGLEYDSDNVNCRALTRADHHANDENPAEEASELTASG
jgi:hypothetical protein